VVVVNSSSPAKTVSELIAYAKSNPGKINIASAGIGSATQVSGEQFKMTAGANLLHVPCRGTAPALTDPKMLRSLAARRNTKLSASETFT
jgi:tripartite-type tricarboxylate transporter receptor subunit TctC